ncbi:MAG: multidrug ABC transporter permease [Alphaproteobacteria bacterium RIFOXYD12_FULL_60_8]|nr:MAG: multidrug ABC transporter permease [Alphaproteobacteria bacterium RIFOXYD12_FULL_60_8]
MSDATPSFPPPRDMGAVNWRGGWTLYLREVRRFVKVHAQTLGAPVVTTLLFLAIFALSLGPTIQMVGQTPFLIFLAPGLIMMSMVQNAFANTSSSLIISKVQGNIVDVLMPPLSAGELTLGFALGGVTRGLAVGLVVWTVMILFIDLPLHSLGYVVFHAFAASLMLSLLGIAGGIWADKFDHMATVTNFIITPLSFLSGTFYSVERLPDAAKVLAFANPFFYMIDGFRFGFIGHADGNPLIGLAVVSGFNAFLLLLVYKMFQTGYKLKA